MNEHVRRCVDSVIVLDKCQQNVRIMWITGAMHLTSLPCRHLVLSVGVKKFECITAIKTSFSGP